jgi:hypothetical protein
MNMKIGKQKVVGWQDFLELCVASWVFISPFVLGYLDNQTATITAMMLGGVAIMFSILGMSTQKIGDEWGNELASLCLIASPWAFGYSEVTFATMNAVACGILMGFLAILAMMEERAEMRREEQLRGH